MTAQPRQPHGVSTGGQYTTKTHAEADITLDQANWGDDEGLDVPDDFEAADIAADWYSGGDATMQFQSTGTITPDGVDDWRRTAAETDDPDPARLVAYMEQKATEDGVALDNEQFLRSLGAYDVSYEDLETMWDDYRAECNNHRGPMRPDEWAYNRGEQFDIANPPAPPVGTMIDTDRARSLPSYTEVEVEFTHIEGKTYRLMARDMARYGRRNRHLSRRFTNLDSGTEVFIGGDDAPRGEPPFTSIRVSKHG